MKKNKQSCLKIYVFGILGITNQERGLASQRPLGRPAGIMPNLTNQMFCWKIADNDLDLRVTIIV